MTEPGEAFHQPVELLDDCDTVVALVRRSGRCDSVEFVQALPDRYQARYQRYLEYLRDGNPIKNPENRRNLRRTDDGLLVLEIKVDKYRLYVVYDGARWFVTHGRTKPKDNRVNAEIDKALDMHAESAPKGDEDGNL